MSAATQTIVLRSEGHFGHKAPARPLGEVLRVMPAAVRQSIRMALEGRSRAKGKRPRWLSAASDIRLVDYGGDDDTILYFEAPRLGEAASDLYDQREFWPTRPAEADTGFDLLGDVIADVAANNEDSDRFDRQLLSQLTRLRTVFDGAFCELLLTARRYPAAHPAVVDRRVIETAKSLSCSTPAATRVRISGILDMVRSSTQTFAVQLGDANEIRGVLVTGDIGDAAKLFRQHVLVLGRAVFRPSGRLLRIDADEILPATDSDRFFSEAPSPFQKPFDLRATLRSQSRKRGVSAIAGQWPGDETDEQIDQALKELS